MQKSNLFANKYRIETTRLKNWDYKWDGYYFVTICTKNKIESFGDVKNDEMHLNQLGMHAHECWANIPIHFPFVKLDEWVVMPDHVHGIIIIDNMSNVDTQNFAYLRNDCNQNQNFAYPRNGFNHNQNFENSSDDLFSNPNKFGPQSKNLGSIVRGFKIGVTKFAELNIINFAWQSRFFERIIRSQDQLTATRLYIKNNPRNWNMNTRVKKMFIRTIISQD